MKHLQRLEVLVLMSHVFPPPSCVGVCFETSSNIPKSDFAAKLIATNKF